MKLTSWIIGWLSISYIGIESLTYPVFAQCVQADISVQYNISGSKEKSDRSSNVDFQNNGACRGNASITTGVQGNVGGNGEVRQTRTVRHRMENGTTSSSINSTNSTVKIKSNPGIDVYNAADSLDN
ncbi:hypothetical protein NIES4102_32880 [Chondrocystis sp. NIES-4102]|nr:hypothetical protein NIES4102_32880 [Chondrocystis sp. NIES-4102]